MNENFEHKQEVTSLGKEHHQKNDVQSPLEPEAFCIKLGYMNARQ